MGFRGNALRQESGEGIQSAAPAQRIGRDDVYKAQRQ